MAKKEWGLCKACKWWQIEPKAAVENLTMGLCIDEKLQPFLLRVSGNSGCNVFMPGKPFALAGLWEQWWGTGDKDPPPLETCSLITTEANKLAQAVHDRMPVILDPVDYDAWLNPESFDAAYMLAPFDADRMTAKPASTYVNNARNQGPECVAESAL